MLQRMLLITQLTVLQKHKWCYPTFLLSASHQYQNTGAGAGAGNVVMAMVSSATDWLFSPCHHTDKSFPVKVYICALNCFVHVNEPQINLIIIPKRRLMKTGSSSIQMDRDQSRSDNHRLALIFLGN